MTCYSCPTGTTSSGGSATTCSDINECNNTTLNKCYSNSECVNVVLTMTSSSEERKNGYRCKFFNDNQQNNDGSRGGIRSSQYDPPFQERYRTSYYKLDQCESDCDTGHCATGLKCWQRDWSTTTHTTHPACAGTTTAAGIPSSNDVCVPSGQENYRP